MNLKEAIELIDPEIDFDLVYLTHLKNSSCSNNPDCHEYNDLKNSIHFLLGRLSQMKREVKRLNKLEGNGIYEVSVIKEYIEALNILINHLEEVLK